jgi:hypothetical protein
VWVDPSLQADCTSSIAFSLGEAIITTDLPGLISMDFHNMWQICGTDLGVFFVMFWLG